MGASGQILARTITDAPQCPALTADGAMLPMTERARPGTVPLRPTKSTPENSKPSAFPDRVCEAVVPIGTTVASIGSHVLPLPTKHPKRIVVIGDTGCRLKASDKAWQACNDPAAWPFARIAAQAAAWHPDLVLHVGDYLYRENACPVGEAGCAGTPWGYGWDAWNADFFSPAAPLLAAAPWIAVRGNHESCARAGQGWWRFLAHSSFEAGRDCDFAADDVRGDSSPTFAVPLGKGAQIIVMDLAISGDNPIPPADPRYAIFRQVQQDMLRLAKGHRYTFATAHYPLLGLSAASKDGQISLKPVNSATLSTFGIADPSFNLPGVDMLLAGHVHEWQQVDFTRDHPGQFISGMAGTQEDVVTVPPELAAGAHPAPGAEIAHFDSWTHGFGFMTLERIGGRRWTVELHDLSGAVIRRCRIKGRHSACN